MPQRFRRALLVVVASLAVDRAWGADPTDSPAATVPPAVVGSPGETRPESDETLEVAVSHKLADDDRVNAMKIKVAVRHGVVTLTGSAKDLEQKEAAEAAVRRVPGVHQVENQIRLVEHGVPPAGSVIPDLPAPPTH